MQPQLSPKKFIQTRARTLPIYKCFVNRDWEVGHLADVFVIRRHVNGHLTAGIYLVDLLCLGIKDTFFFFNEDEDELMDKLPMHMFMEIDYSLAHNIIFAGHDYAMEYDIHPHQQFSITRNILEEDDDGVPLIEIQTGDKNGNPLLVVAHAGQFSEALAKLKKNAGEGNFGYVVKDEYTDDAQLVADEVEMVESELDDYEFGSITALDAQEIRFEEFMDSGKFEGRSPDEQVCLNIEGLLRLLRMKKPEVFDFDYVDELPEYDRHLLLPAEDLNGLDEPRSDGEYLQDEQIRFRISNTILDSVAAGAIPGDVIKEQVALYEMAPLQTFVIFEMELMVTPAERPITLSKMQVYAEKYPYAKLLVALAALIHPGLIPGDYDSIYNSGDISEAVPGYSSFDLKELFIYWLIRFRRCLNDGSVTGAIHFYMLIAETEEFNLLYFAAQVDFLRMLQPLVDESFPATEA